MLKTLQHKLEPEFTFAGFTFPKYVWTLPRGSMASRLERARNPCTGGYYHAPTPNSNKGVSLYLNSDGGPKLRWKWCDDVAPSSINHTGWYTDEDGDSEKIRGVVFYLPHGRCLTGWSMGEGMASMISTSEIFDNELDAAYDADEVARIAADNEREYQAREQARIYAQEQAEEEAEAAHWAERDTVTKE
jgi:hypothetical protein